MFFPEFEEHVLEFEEHVLVSDQKGCLGQDMTHCPKPYDNFAQPEPSIQMSHFILHVQTLIQKLC